MAPDSEKYKLHQEALHKARLIPFAINREHARREYGASLKAYQAAVMSDWKARGGQRR